MNNQRIAKEMAEDIEGRCTKPGKARPAPMAFDPSPKDHKSLSEMAALVNDRYERLRGVSRPTLLDQALLGGTLRLMKDELRHGVYQWWVRNYLSFGCRTARRYLERFYHHMATKDDPPVEEPEPEPTPEEAETDERMLRLLVAPAEALKKKSKTALRSITRTRRSI